MDTSGLNLPAASIANLDKRNEYTKGIMAQIKSTFLADLLAASDPADITRAKFAYDIVQQVEQTVSLVVDSLVEQYQDRDKEPTVHFDS